MTAMLMMVIFQGGAPFLTGFAGRGHSGFQLSTVVLSLLAQTGIDHVVNGGAVLFNRAPVAFKEFRSYLASDAHVTTLTS
jgi:hypothetical protein